MHRLGGAVVGLVKALGLRGIWSRVA